MRKIVYIPLLAGAAMVVTGCTILGFTIPSYGTNNKVTNTYDLTDQSFTNFAIDVSTSKVIFKVSEDSSTKVVCQGAKKDTQKVEVKDNTLNIEFHQEKKWFNVSDLLIGERSVTVYLPSSTYGSLNLRFSTGDIEIASGFTFSESNIDGSTGDLSFKSNVSSKAFFRVSTGDIKLTDMSCNELEALSSTGKKYLTNVTVNETVRLEGSTGKTFIDNLKCKNLDINVTTGDVNIKNTLISNEMKVRASTGDIDINDSDAGSVDILTDTGDVDAVFLTSKIVYATSDTGKIKVPTSTEGGLCKITTDTGHIYVSIK